jgi:hypothetical protein
MMPRLPNAGDLISLQEAAAYAGYRSPSTLRKAAREGTLRTVRLGPRAIMTTYDWVSDYEMAIYGKGGRPRGTVRS